MILRWIPTLVSCMAAMTACSLIAPSDSELLKPPGTGGTRGGGSGGTASSAGTRGDGGSAAAGTGAVGTDASQGAGGSGPAGTAGDDDGGNRGGTGNAGSAGASGEGGVGGSGGTTGNGGVDAGGDASGTGGLAGTGGTGGTTSLPLDGMVLWLTAMKGVVRTGSAVSKWEDQSAFDNDATQNALHAQPTLGNDWGLPTVDFDGTDHFLVLPASASFADFSRGLTAFFAIESHGGGPCQSLIQFSNGPNADEILVQRETEGDFVYKAPGGLARCGRNTIPINEQMLVEVLHSGSEASLYAGGVYCGGGTVGPLNNVVRNSATIGRAAQASCARYSGHIAEVIVYNRALRPEERTAVELQLQIRWGI